ncbi:MAG: YdcF family protein [Spirosomataceae bacterium]
MFFFFSKIFSFFLTPLGLFFVSLGLVLYLKKYQKRLISGLLVGLYIVSNQWIVNVLVRAWEPPIESRSTVNSKKWGIVLTGGFFEMDSKIARENLHLGLSSDRLWQAYRLYKEGKIEKILISGGYVPLVSRTAQIETTLARDFLLQNGVPMDDIILETKARNTYENAVYSVSLAKKQGILPSECYIITSSYHIKRALACFRKQGFDAAFFGTNPSQANLEWKWIFLIPSRHALADFLDLYHEWFGYLSYWIVGYI